MKQFEHNGNIITVTPLGNQSVTIEFNGNRTYSPVFNDGEGDPFFVFDDHYIHLQSLETV